MAEPDQRFTLVARNGDELFPYQKAQKSTGRYGFALSPPGTKGDRLGGGVYTADIRDVIRRVVLDGWGVRVKKASGSKREGTFKLDGTAIASYRVAPEFFDLVAGARVKLMSLVPIGNRPASSAWQTSQVVDLPAPTAPMATVVTGIGADEQAQLTSETTSLTTSEQEAVVRIWYGQSAFRDALIAIDGAKCWMSGVEGERLLIASHIKPWWHCREDDQKSRGCLDNGLLLSALWDMAFDSGLFAFAPDWSIVCSTELSASARTALGISVTGSLPPKHRTFRRNEFLAYHRRHDFLAA